MTESDSTDSEEPDPDNNIPLMDRYFQRHIYVLSSPVQPAPPRHRGIQRETNMPLTRTQDGKIVKPTTTGAGRTAEPPARLLLQQGTTFPTPTSVPTVTPVEPVPHIANVYCR